MANEGHKTAYPENWKYLCLPEVRPWGTTQMTFSCARTTNDNRLDEIGYEIQGTEADSRYIVYRVAVF